MNHEQLHWMTEALEKQAAAMERIADSLDVLVAVVTAKPVVIPAQPPQQDMVSWATAFDALTNRPGGIREEKKMSKFRKKPVVIEARQFTDDDSAYAILRWAGGPVGVVSDCGILSLEVLTLEGTMRASRGDWIIRGVKGEFYPCKPDVFAATYEQADCELSNKGEIHDHKVHGKSGGNDDTAIVYFDDKGQGGARHHYSVLSGSQVLLDVRFQDGPIQEVGVNGVQQEHLLAVVIDRLRDFQAGPFAGRYNDKALGHCEEALMWLQRRTVDRIRRGVEGFNEA